METEKKISNDHGKTEENEEAEALELVLFHVSECYVYMIPPRKTAASYRADEWDVNKWTWEGALKVISKGEECIIRLQDKNSGELYAQAFLRKGEPHPVEPVIDSSRYFVLRVEESIGGRRRHAFIGIGFRERTEAYDFQAALHDHMKYLNKKQTAEEMEQQFQKTSSVDYSLKEGETLVLQIKNKNTGGIKAKICEQGLNNLSLEEKGNRKDPLLSIKPPPPPAAPVSPSSTVQKSTFNSSQPPLLPATLQTSPSNLSPPPAAPASSPPSDQAGSKSPENLELKEDSEDRAQCEPETETKEPNTSENKSSPDIPDDDFGDFQMAG